jgi:hypothetical protein
MKTGEGNVGGGDGSNNTTATAAKVAAEVAPNVVTGGIVAETGPRPDFSLWTVEDDLLLKNAVEVKFSTPMSLILSSQRFGSHLSMTGMMPARFC